MLTSSAGTLRVAIVGGGIGGLAAAALLHRVGLPSAVDEQAPELKEVGAGLVPAPKGVRTAWPATATRPSSSETQ
ncbi:hypothetical protein SNL152K_2622 [Streptomyces sp. NL15-2K]|nr:hypothetical protein SNL152K_2622 [Streptomyces sp. NL15-2K]